MGQNKRYPELLEGDIARASDKIDRQTRPVGLSEPELKSSGMRRDAREPIPVTAWIPHQVLWTEPQLGARRPLSAAPRSCRAVVRSSCRHH